MATVNETLAAKAGGMGDPMGPVDDNIDCSYGTYGVFVVAVLFQFLNLIVKSVGPPKSLRDDEWKWRNLLISCLHALASVIWSFTSLITQWEVTSDLQHYKTYTIVFLITFSTGYFLYDFLDIALSGKMIVMWEVQLHHVAVGGMFFYNLVNCEWLGFNIIALLVEVNSFFLHLRKLLQMVGTSYSSKLYRSIVFLNISTFIVFRGFALMAIAWAMTQWYSRVTLTYYLSLGMAMVVMLVMNPILFMRLLRSDYLRSRRSVGGGGKSAPASKTVTVMNGNNNHLNNGCAETHQKQS